MCWSVGDSFFILAVFISDSLEELHWCGSDIIQLYNILRNVPGVWDCTTQDMMADSASDVEPTLVGLEENDYMSVGVFLPDWLIQKMNGTPTYYIYCYPYCTSHIDWYLVELVSCQQQPHLLGQYEAQLSITHMRFKGCNCQHSWSWEVHHIKSYSLDFDQLVLEVGR